MNEILKLMNKNFLLVWQGQLVSQIGNQLYNAAMMFWIIELTGSASIMGILLMLSILPSVVLSPIAGIFADRYSRRKIMIATDFVSGLILLALVIAIYLIPNEQTFLLVLLFVVSVLMSSMGTFFGPAVAASIPDTVPKDKLEKANSIYAFTGSFAQIIGQFLGGVIFVFFGAPILFLFNALSYIYARICSLFMAIPQNQIIQESFTFRQTFQSFKRDLLEGGRFVKNSKGMLESISVTVVYNFFAWPFLTLLPFFLKDNLKVGIEWYSYFMGSFGLGVTLGYLLDLGLDSPWLSISATIPLSSSL